MSLTTRVLVGGTLGILVGFFFGAACHVLSPIGFAYVMLLEAAVYPYLICSLLQGLGSLEPAKAWRLFTRGWAFYALAWAVTFGGLAILTYAIPAVRVPITGSAAPPTQTVSNLLELLIPNDLFAALTRNYVPAVVLFCIFYGVAVQSVPDKRPLLSVLEAIRLASLRFWNWIVLLSPVGVFALFAYTTGTTALRDLLSLSVYLALFLLGTLLLALWALPALLAALAPIGYREVLRETRAALSIAAVTTLSVASLPFIAEITRKLADRCGITESERDAVIRTNLAVAYPLGQLGNFFIYLFLLFAAYYYRTPIEPLDRMLLPVMTLLSGFGSPTSAVNAVSFLSGWLPLPGGTPGLYVEMQTITRYGQVIVSVMGFAFLSILVTLAYYGKLRLRPGRLAAALVLPALALGGIAWAGHAVHGYLATSVAAYRTFQLDPELVQAVHATVLRTAADDDSSRSAAPEARATTTGHIQATGVLRVGYNASIMPFCYFNADGTLVGYDVTQAYDLARSLNVRLVFIPFEWDHLERDLLRGRFDIAMAGIYVTPRRLAEMTVSAPYFQSPLALFLPAKEAQRFRTREGILAMRGVRIGVFDDPVLRPLVARLLPNAEVVVVPDYATLPDFTRIDAAVWTLEQAATLARAHEDIAVVVPRDLGSPFLFAYLMPPESSEMRRFVNYWLELRRADGSEARRLAYWIHGQLPPPTQPRWSVARDVLHWIK